jgi:hypothetical protein
MLCRDTNRAVFVPYFEGELVSLDPSPISKHGKSPPFTLLQEKS